jgi:hypothetical protein
MGCTSENSASSSCRRLQVENKVVRIGRTLDVPYFFGFEKTRAPPTKLSPTRHDRLPEAFLKEDILNRSIFFCGPSGAKMATVVATFNL